MDTLKSAPEIFQTSITIHFKDADPAGILFFGNILGLAHDVFEEFIVDRGILWSDWFKSKEWGCPIRHTEVDYLLPFAAGQSYQVFARMDRMSQSSIYMHYEFRNNDQKLCARVQMIHTFVSLIDFQKIDIPNNIKILLNPNDE